MLGCICDMGSPFNITEVLGAAKDCFVHWGLNCTNALPASVSPLGAMLEGRTKWRPTNLKACRCIWNLVNWRPESFLEPKSQTLASLCCVLKGSGLLLGGEFQSQTTWPIQSRRLESLPPGSPIAPSDLDSYRTHASLRIFAFATPSAGNLLPYHILQC